MTLKYYDEAEVWTARNAVTAERPSRLVMGSVGMLNDVETAGRPSNARGGLTALREFVDSNATGGLLLLVAALIALAWSNSPAFQTYDELWRMPISFGVDPLALDMSLAHWINDGLMVVFFLLVGLEIKRELVVGELDTVQRALLPALAAVAGAVLPALIFLLIVGPGSEAARGWGVPMATDIAFALGVLAVLGSRVPGPLRVFVTALAIVDDILAIAVIAVFYAGEISMLALGASVVICIVLFAANRLGIRSLAVYSVGGVLLWLAVLQSGVHPTVAGVVLALTIPGPSRSTRTAREHNRDAPLIRLEHILEKPVAFVIVPLFALANAGVHIDRPLLETLNTPIVLGIFAGLILGKQIGITGSTVAAAAARVVHLPTGVSVSQMYGASWVAAIGFTMSLFIAHLAYQDAKHLAEAKVGILAASIVAGSVGFLLLRLLPLRAKTETGGPTSA
jgi:NhaA family Na+:H+ antiporter